MTIPRQTKVADLKIESIDFGIKRNTNNAIMLIRLAGGVSARLHLTRDTVKKLQNSLAELARLMEH